MVFFKAFRREVYFTDNRGFIFTFDAVLALIPFFIIIVSVTNMGGSQLSSSSSHIHSLQNAQDILEIMATNSMDSNVLQDMATILTANNDSDIGIHEAGKIAYTYLNKTIKNSKYSLMETKQTNRVIASNGDMENAGNVSVGFKSYKGYVFKLYIWKQIPY